MLEEPFRGFAHVLFRTDDPDEARMAAHEFARDSGKTAYVDRVSPPDVFVPGFGRRGLFIAWTLASGPLDAPREEEILDLRHVPQPYSHRIEPRHPLQSPKERFIRDVLDGDEIFPLLRDFYASTRRERTAWMRALDAFSYRDLDRLAVEAKDYGTAAGVELKDAIQEIFDLRRSQGRSRR